MPTVTIKPKTMIRRILIVLVVLCVPIGIINAQETKKITLSFSETDFPLHYNEDGSVSVTNTGGKTAIFKEDESLPGLPYVPINVLVPPNAAFSNVECTFTKRRIKQDVELTQNPKSVPTNVVTQTQPVTLPYPDAIYPASNAEFTGTNIMDGSTLMGFLVCPFIYDNDGKDLYLLNTITLDISLSQKPGMLAHSTSKGVMDEVVKSIVVNADDFTEVHKQRALGINIANKDRAEYIVITSPELKKAFEPLVRWKTTKGVKAEVVTTDYIDQNYEGASMQLKIKACIYDYYQNKGLKYVLLGGDDTVVPVYYCYVNMLSESQNYIPTDLFYSCFGGDFDWNANGNNRYGEADNKYTGVKGDNVNLTPSVFLTRLPIRTSNEVNAFWNKLYAYERPNAEVYWNNNILLCGNNLSNGKTGNALAMGNQLYSKYIKPYWGGGKVRFYSDYTDFLEGEDYPLNEQNMQNQFSKGFAFVDVIGHGGEVSWNLGYDNHYYNTSAMALKSLRSGTIITTLACSTNAFDSSNNDPCLSEGFIRNSNSGVLAYLGCSREGWYSLDSIMGPSIMYEAHFYKRLFTSLNKNYGAVIAAAKADMIPSCSETNRERWVQFGLNPIGDPEMPIFTSQPKNMEGVTIRKADNGDILVNPGGSPQGFKVCVMSTADMGKSYYAVNSFMFSYIFKNIDTDVTVCITKPGYIPVVVDLKSELFLQNETISGTKEYKANVITIGSSVTSAKPKGNVIFKSGDITIKGKDVTIYGGTTINKEANFTITNK